MYKTLDSDSGILCSMEGFKKPEGITEQEVVEALDSRGIEDLEVRALLEKYIDQCSREADLEVQSDPDNPKTPNRANIKAQIKIAILLSKTKNYRDEALESFNDVLNAASQDESTQDLFDEINLLIIENNK